MASLKAVNFVGGFARAAAPSPDEYLRAQMRKPAPTSPHISPHLPYLPISPPIPPHLEAQMRKADPYLPTSPRISRPQMRKADPYLPTSPRMCVLGPPGGPRHLPLDSAGLRRVQLKPQPVPPRACCGHSPRLFGMPQAPARLTISPHLSPSLPRYLSAEVDPIQAFAAPVFGHRDIAEIDAEIKPRYAEI